MIAAPTALPSRKLLILLFAAAFALRIGFMQVRGTLGQSPSIERGYREYVMAGTRLLRHGVLVSPLILEDVDHQPSALMPPVYVGFVAGVYALFGVEARAATLVLQGTNAAATALVVVLVCSLASTMAGRRAGLIAALLAAINPLLIGFSDFIWDTSLFALGVTSAICWSHRLGNATPSRKSWFAFGCYMGALALLNPALTVAYPILVLWPLARRNAINWHSMVRPVLITISGWAMFITPWTVRNYVHFGQLMYVRSGLGLEFWLGSCPQADAHGAAVFRSQFPLNNSDLQRHVAEVGERAFIQESTRKAKEAIAADPLRFLRLTGYRLIDFWCGTTLSHSRNDSVDNPRSRLRMAITAFLGFEMLALTVGYILCRGLRRETNWLLATCALFCVVYVLTHVQLRYRAPIEPVTAVIVGSILRRERVAA